MRNVTALALALVLVAAADQATGQTEAGAAPVRSGQYGEAPMLAALVASGELPPVEERLPETPRVLEVAEIGTYGGALQQVRNLDASDWLAWVMTKEPLTIISPDLLSTLPNVAREFEVSEDGTTITFTLRPGMRWSDGAPFGVDDLLFWYEDLISNKELTPEPISYFTRNNELLVVSKVDDNTVTFTFSLPNSPFVDMIGTWWMYFVPQYAPKHYMSQFHPTYTDREKLNDLVKSEGFASWPELYHSKDCVGHPSQGVHDPACPSLGPWQFQDPKTAPVQTAVRNPYYFKIDPEGNQLPYIDRVERPLISDTEAWLLKVVAGEEDVVLGSFLDPGKNFTFLKQNEARGGYKVKTFTWWRNHSTLYFNHTTADEVKAELYANKDFRIALSHAINRDEINGLLFGGRYTPSQLSPNSGPPFHGERDMFKQFIEYDPDKANAMLDEIGLAARDRDGNRLDPDGNALQFILYHPSWPPENPELGDLIRGYWAEVGINLAVKAMDASRLYRDQRCGRGGHAPARRLLRRPADGADHEPEPVRHQLRDRARVVELAQHRRGVGGRAAGRREAAAGDPERDLRGAGSAEAARAVRRGVHDPHEQPLAVGHPGVGRGDVVQLHPEQPARQRARADAGRDHPLAEFLVHSP